MKNVYVVMWIMVIGQSLMGSDTDADQSGDSPRFLRKLYPSSGASLKPFTPTHLNEMLPEGRELTPRNMLSLAVAHSSMGSKRPSSSVSVHPLQRKSSSFQQRVLEFKRNQQASRRGLLLCPQVTPDSECCSSFQSLCAAARDLRDEYIEELGYNAPLAGSEPMIDDSFYRRRVVNVFNSAVRGELRKAASEFNLSQESIPEGLPVYNSGSSLRRKRRSRVQSTALPAVLLTVEHARRRASVNSVNLDDLSAIGVAVPLVTEADSSQESTKRPGAPHNSLTSDTVIVSSSTVTE